MKVKLFAVHDSKTEAFMQPFFAVTAAHAIRIFSDTVNSPDTVLSKHPADFHLFQVGEFDDSNAALVPENPPFSLASALEFVNKELVK